MSKLKKIPKKKFRSLPEVEFFYKIIYKYNLRESAYTSALKTFLRLKNKKLI